MLQPEDERRTSRSDDDDARSRLAILHLIVSLGHSNAQYNEHCLPLSGERDISICSFSAASVTVPPSIRLFEGDGTIRGFAAAIERAFDDGPYDVVHAHAPGTGALLVIVNLLHGRSLSNAVLTVHNSRESFPLKNQFLLAPLLVAFPTVVFCSHAALASFPRAIRSIGGDAVVVQNGVDTDRIARTLADDRGRQGQQPGFRLVSVGRLIERKDPFTLIGAFELMADAEDRLTYVGDGRLRSDVLERADRARLGAQVTVTGVVDREDVYRWVARSDLFVSTSHREGLPVSVLEAMACGLPVVVSDIPSHREIADGASFVPLVEPGDADGFAREIRRFKAMSPDQRTAVGDGCRELVERAFSLGQMHRACERVYEQVRAPRRRRDARERAPVGRNAG